MERACSVDGQYLEDVIHNSFFGCYKLDKETTLVLELEIVQPEKKDAYAYRGMYIIVIL